MFQDESHKNGGWFSCGELIKCGFEGMKNQSTQQNPHTLQKGKKLNL